MPSAEQTDPRARPDEPRSAPNHVLNIVGVAISDQVEGRRPTCSVPVQVTMSGRRQRAGADQQSPVEPRPKVRGALSDEKRCRGSTLADTRQTINWSLFPHGSSYLFGRCGPILLEPVAVVVEISGSSNSSEHLSLARARQGILRNQAPRPRLPWFVPKPLAQERPTGSG